MIHIGHLKFPQIAFFLMYALGSDISYTLCTRAKSLQSCLILFSTPQAVAYEAPLSMGFSRQEYWSGLPHLLPGDLPDPGMETVSVTTPTLTGEFLTTSSAWEAQQTKMSAKKKKKKKKKVPVSDC